MTSPSMASNPVEIAVDNPQTIHSKDPTPISIEPINPVPVHPNRINVSLELEQKGAKNETMATVKNSQTIPSQDPKSISIEPVNPIAVPPNRTDVSLDLEQTGAKNETMKGVNNSQTIHSKDQTTISIEPINPVSVPPNRTDASLELEQAVDMPNETKVELGLVQPSTPELAAYLQNLSQQPCTSLTPWPNITSVAFAPGRFYSGYRNQMMGFTMLILHTLREGYGQLLLPSIYMKDLYGTNRTIPFQDLWDIPHFNSFYPALPRLVNYDPILHEQFNPQTISYPWFRNADRWLCNSQGTFCTNNTSVRPYRLGDNSQFLGAYLGYVKGAKPFGNSTTKQRHPAEILMLRGALRPHPQLQSILYEKQKELVGGSNNNTNKSNDTEGDYMTLHARVEPDMQIHPVCPKKKVLNLTDIFEFLESTWKDPPVAKVFLPINRPLLEQVQGKGNTMAEHNLKELNRARDYGLWNGRAKVFECGSNSLQGTPYEKKPRTPAAMLDFFLSVDAKIFVGTEVSSFSHDVLATRFFRGHTENYKFLPQGLVHWTPPGTTVPPGFSC